MSTIPSTCVTSGGSSAHQELTGRSESYRSSAMVERLLCDSAQTGQNPSKLPLRRISESKVEPSVVRVQLSVGCLRRLFRRVGFEGRADMLLCLRDCFEGASRQKSKNRGAEPGHFAARYQHRASEHVGVHLA